MGGSYLFVYLDPGGDFFLYRQCICNFIKTTCLQKSVCLYVIFTYNINTCWQILGWMYMCPKQYYTYINISICTGYTYVNMKLFQFPMSFMYIFTSYGNIFHMWKCIYIYIYIFICNIIIYYICVWAKLSLFCCISLNLIMLPQKSEIGFRRYICVQSIAR